MGQMYMLAHNNEVPILPFLQDKKKLASVIIAHRKPDGSHVPDHAEDEHDPGLQSAAEDLIRAVHSKNATDVADALKAAFQIIDAEPHKEGPHPDEEDEQENE